MGGAEARGRSYVRMAASEIPKEILHLRGPGPRKAEGRAANDSERSRRSRIHFGDNGVNLAEAHGNRTRRGPRQGAPIDFEDRAAHQLRMRLHGGC